MAPEIQKMLSHQVKVGGLKDGDTADVKFAGDGFNISKRDVGTAHTVTILNAHRALQIGTISIVNAIENYQVLGRHDQLIILIIVSLYLYLFSKIG